MKRLIHVALLLILISGCGKSVDESTLLERNGLKYLPNSNDPYSGQVFSFYENKQKKMEGTYKDGIKIGKFTFWLENGQRIDQEEFYERNTLLEKTNIIAAKAVEYWRKPVALGGGARSFIGVRNISNFRIEISDEDGKFIMSSITRDQFTLTATGPSIGVVIVTKINKDGISGTPVVRISELEKNKQEIKGN